MESKSLRHKTLKGTIWSSIERFSVQGLSFLIMIFMARVLTPADYGLIGELSVFIAISMSLVDSGFSQALIRKQNRTETDNCTVFYFNIAISAILYGILFISAPTIARFYNEPLLTPLTRVISLVLIINSFGVVQRALLVSNLDFKTQAKASFSGILLGGIVGIIMTYSGFGVWSLVWYQIISATITLFVLWFISPWRPQILYSWQSFRELFGFGSKMAISGIINTLYQNIYLIVIGKVFRPADLGFYTRAQQFAQLPSQNLNDIVQRVSYPVLCTISDNDERLRNVYRRFLRLSAFIVFPLMIGLAVLAHPLIIIILKPQWEFAATLLSILCLSMMWYPIHAINLNLLQVKGRSDLFLRLEIIKKIIGIAILIITIPIGLIAMCIGSIFSSLICLAINTYYTGKLIQVGFFTQMRDLLPTIIYSLSMGVIILGATYFLQADWLKLVVGTLIGIAYYFSITKFTDSTDLQELRNFIKAK